jgi:hypothetical protein
MREGSVRGYWARKTSEDDAIDLENEGENGFNLSTRFQYGDTAHIIVIDLNHCDSILQEFCTSGPMCSCPSP